MATLSLLSPFPRGMSSSGGYQQVPTAEDCMLLTQPGESPNVLLHQADEATVVAEGGGSVLARLAGGGAGDIRPYQGLPPAPGKSGRGSAQLDKPPVFRSWKERGGHGVEKGSGGGGGLRASRMGPGFAGYPAAGGATAESCRAGDVGSSSPWAIESSETRGNHNSKAGGIFMKALRSISNMDGTKRKGKGESRRTMSDCGSGGSFSESSMSRPESPEVAGASPPPAGARLAATGRSITESGSGEHSGSPLKREGSLKAAAAPGNGLRLSIQRSASHGHGQFEAKLAEQGSTWIRATGSALMNPPRTPPSVRAPLTPPATATSHCPLPPLPADSKPRPTSAGPSRPPRNPGERKEEAKQELLCSLSQSALQQLSTEERIQLHALEKQMKKTGRRASSTNNVAAASAGADSCGGGDNSDDSSEDGDGVGVLNSRSGPGRSASHDGHRRSRSRNGEKESRHSEAELQEMVEKIDEKLRKLRHKRGLYQEKLQRILKKKEQLAGPIQQWLRPSTST